MVPTEVQRTLVKSPPELWAELSDAASLYRHLGELGEIRITRLQPETEVEWRAERASGSVLIKPPGWGTRVWLSVTPEPAAPAPPAPATPAQLPVATAAPADAQADEPPRVAFAKAPADNPLAHAPTQAPVQTPAQAPAHTFAASAAREPEDLPPDAEPQLPPDALRELPPVAEPEAEESAGEPTKASRKGFLARFFTRIARGREQLPGDGAEPAEPPRGAHEAESELPCPPEGVGRGAIEALQARFEVPREQPAPEPPTAELSSAASDGERQPPASEASRQPPPASEASSQPPEELEHSVEPQAGLPIEQQITELLTAMLDRLGAAHHRPFSRA